MKLITGPFLDDHIQELLYYLSEKIHTETRYFNEYRLSSLKTFPDNGEYTVDDLKIKIENLGEHFVQNGNVLKKASITLEGSEHDIEDLCKKIEKSSKQLPRVEGSVNILINNVYLGSWRIDEQIPTRSVENINLKNIEKIFNDFEMFFSEERKQYYKKLEIPYNRIYMLYGPPGTGKTTLIHGVASRFNKHIANLDFTKEMDDRMFRETLRSVPDDTILCIEDIDCLFEERKAHDSFSSSVTFSGILNALDGLTRHEGLAIIITTNHLRTLDAALKRRIDYFMEFDYCSQEQVRQVYDRFCLDPGGWAGFWETARFCKLTPNILQKYFIKYPKLEESIKEFSTHLSTENENMYN